MTVLCRVDAKQLIDAATARFSLPFFWRGISSIFGLVVWGGRKVVYFPSLIKELFFHANYPVQMEVGVVAVFMGLFEKNAYVRVAIRIVSLLRPLISFSDAGENFRKSANNIVRGLRQNKKVTHLYLETQGKLTPFSKTRLGFFFSHTLSAFTARFVDTVVHSAIFAGHSVDLFEAFSTVLDTSKEAEDKHIIKSLAELSALTELIGSQKILNAIDFHQGWIDKLLRQASPSFNVGSLKERIVDIGKITSSKWTSMSITEAIAIITSMFGIN